MFQGWTKYPSREAAYAALPERDGTQADYWTDSGAGKSWIDPQGRRWVLTFIQNTREMMIFPQDGDQSSGPVWISQPWVSQHAADAQLEGWDSAEGKWPFLEARL